MKVRAVFLFSIAVVTLLVACSPRKNEPPQKKSEGAPPWNMALQTQPEKPGMNKDVLFRLTMTDMQKQPVSGAQVRGSLVMPLMDMGKNEFTLADRGQGVYEGTGKMDMAGPWELVVMAKVGSVEGRKTFPLTVGE